MFAHRNHPRKGPIPTVVCVRPALSARRYLRPLAIDNTTRSARHLAYEGRMLALLVVERLLLGASCIALIAAGTILLGHSP
jgi:hypothetical protein